MLLTAVLIKIGKLAVAESDLLEFR